MLMAKSLQISFEEHGLFGRNERNSANSQRINWLAEGVAVSNIANQRNGQQIAVDQLIGDVRGYPEPSPPRRFATRSASTMKITGEVSDGAARQVRVPDNDR
jgi:hypothetical protein